MGTKATETYEVFIRFEERSAELYLELSVRFLDNPAVSWFWVEMAMEEKQHAGMLQHCRETGIFTERLPDQRQIEKLDALFGRLEARIAAPQLNLDDAFDVAIRLEASEINDLYGRLTAPIEGPAYVMRKKMELSAANHFHRLYEASRQFNASVQIQSRLAKLSAAGSLPQEHP